ncbi:1071_t:CDS:2, partial [Funneliformis geosporum]
KDAEIYSSQEYTIWDESDGATIESLSEYGTTKWKDLATSYVNKTLKH